MRKLSILAAALLIASPVVSQAKTLEELLVEKGVITKGEAKGAGSGPSKVYWNDGTRVEFPDAGFTLGVNAQIQTRYTFFDKDGGKNTSSFDVTNARVILSGSALHEEFEYLLSGDFVGARSADKTDNLAGTNYSPALKDAYLKWNACDWASVQMGQFKTNLGRQFNTKDHALQFADRSIASDYFDLGRQSGAKAVLQVGEGAALGAGIYNGLSELEGINSSGVDTRHTGVVDIRADVLGTQDPYSEADVDTTSEPALNVGAAYAYSDSAGNVTEDVFTTLQVQSVAVDASFKYDGWGIAGEFFVADFSADDVDYDSTPVGGYIQAGYFVEPKELELAARYSVVGCDNGTAPNSIGGGTSNVLVSCVGADQVQQVSATVNYYWWAHRLKAQFGYDIVTSNPEGPDQEDTNDNRWLLQLSSYF